MIGIRVDVNQNIATGHVKRDIAIALCLREMGHECIFISADENVIPYLEPLGFEVVVLHTKWDEMDGEVEILEDIIKSRQIDSLLVDSYMVTENYMKRIKELTYVTYFDELGYLGYGAQQLINGVLEPPDYSNVPGKALLGPPYVSMRQEFMNLPRKVAGEEMKTLLVTSGGTDNYHFCLQFLEYFLKQDKWQKLHVIAVVGELSLDKEELSTLYANSDRVELHIATNKMAELMQRADYAITAGGTTLYEICACGLSASCYAIADNQLEIAHSFHNQGLVSYAGDFREGAEATFKKISCQMEEAKNKTVRQEKANKLQSMVDGRGAYRIAEELIL